MYNNLKGNKQILQQLNIFYKFDLNFEENYNCKNKKSTLLIPEISEKKKIKLLCSRHIVIVIYIKSTDFNRKSASKQKQFLKLGVFEIFTKLAKYF